MAKSPDAFRTISEVAEWLDTQPHVLRFWESKFTQVKPVKRAGGRRYYRPNDMLLLGGIKRLLHDDGMTIKGVQKILREHGIRHVSAMSSPLDQDDLGGLDAGLDTGPAMDDSVLDTPPQEAPVDTGTILPFQGRTVKDGLKETPSAPPTPSTAIKEPAETPAESASGPSSVETAADTDAAEEAPRSGIDKTVVAKQDAPATSAPAKPPRIENDSMPSFVRRSVSPATPSSDVSDPDPAPVEPAATVQASADSVTNTVTDGVPGQSDQADETENTPAAPRPRIVVVPEDCEDSAPASSGLLGDIAKGGPLATGSLGEISRLLDRLDDWRSGQGQHPSE